MSHNDGFRVRSDVSWQLDETTMPNIRVRPNAGVGPTPRQV
jgi:hypothetical protein